MGSMYYHQCTECGAAFTPHRRTQQFCSAECRLASYMLPCTYCGEKTTTRISSGRDPETVVHRKCYPGPRSGHGSFYWYKNRGCRCDLCRTANASAQREFTARYRAETGRMYRTNFAYPNGQRGRWISDPERLAIYERDNWTCQMCGRHLTTEGIDYWSAEYPSLDHIVPRSKGGTHAPDNLQTLCRGCNSSKKDKL